VAGDPRRHRLASVVLALILGIPTLRLRADYLAIVTIAAAEILRFTSAPARATRSPAACSASSASPTTFYASTPSPGRYGFGHVHLDARARLWVMIVGWGLVALCCLLTWALMRSPWGRVLRSIREDEDAARSLGKNVFGYKMQSLVLGGVIGALGGMVSRSTDQQACNPDTYVPSSRSSPTRS
jgi:neutral amino acid transport system permease protein